ncbi:MAG: inositol monophosphatase [Dictyoglomi bacterium]|nr:inositol monophosphatase [Dictyoglomota bacterium]
MDIGEMMSIASEAAYLAGEVLQSKYLHVKDIREKTDITDLVTEADKEAEKVVRAYLEGVLDDKHSIVGEEGGGSATGRYVWYVDPLDGTANFAKGVPIFSVSVGMLDEGRFSVGAIYHPTEDVLYWGSVEVGAWINGRKLVPRYEAEIRGAYVGLGFPRRCTEGAKDAALIFQEYSVLHARKLRSIGSAALGLAWVAAGFLDVYFQPCLSMWDMAAGVALVLAVGGSVYIHKVDDTTYGVWASGNNDLYTAYAEIIPYLKEYVKV